MLSPHRELAQAEKSEFWGPLAAAALASASVVCRDGPSAHTSPRFTALAPSPHPKPASHWWRRCQCTSPSLPAFPVGTGLLKPAQKPISSEDPAPYLPCSHPLWGPGSKYHPSEVSGPQVPRPCRGRKLRAPTWSSFPSRKHRSVGGRKGDPQELGHPLQSWAGKPGQRTCQCQTLPHWGAWEQGSIFNAQ